MVAKVYFKRFPKKRTKSENPSFSELIRLSKRGNFPCVENTDIIYDFLYREGLIPKNEPCHAMVSVEALTKLFWLCKNRMCESVETCTRLRSGWKYTRKEYENWERGQALEMYLVLGKFRRRIKETDHIWVEFSWLKYLGD